MKGGIVSSSGRRGIIDRSGGVVTVPLENNRIHAGKAWVVSIPFTDLADSSVTDYLIRITIAAGQLTSHALLKLFWYLEAA